MERRERFTTAASADAGQAPRENQRALGWHQVLRIAFVAFAAVAVRLHLWEPFASVSLIGVLGVLIGGWPVFREAAENIIARRMTMELSMSIAIAAAAAFVGRYSKMFLHADYFRNSSELPQGRRSGGASAGVLLTASDGPARTWNQSVEARVGTQRIGGGLFGQVYHVITALFVGAP